MKNARRHRRCRSPFLGGKPTWFVIGRGSSRARWAKPGAFPSRVVPPTTMNAGSTFGDGSALGVALGNAAAVVLL